MPMMLIIPAEQAASLYGATRVGHALYPVLLADGTFALPMAVLADPAHLVRRAVLAELPAREVSDEEFPPPDGAA